MANSLDANLTSEKKRNLFGNAYLNMLWHCPSDPRFPYRVHLPDDYYEDPNPHYSLMVIIHGTGCATEAYLHAIQGWADKHRVALLAPLFPGGLIHHDDFNSYKLLSSDGIRYDQILLSMIADMEQRYPGVDGSRFFLFGHSGGGQFANRFLFVHPERLLAVSIGAPGRPTYLNYEEDYYWGVRDFRSYFDKEPDPDAIRRVSVQITVGEYDTKYIGESPYGSCRVERMKSLVQNFRSNGISAELKILPGLEHADGSAERIASAAAFFETYLNKEHIYEN